REANKVQSVSDTEETNRTWSLTHDGQNSLGPFESPWIEHEIWIFLQEWEVVEYEMGHQANIKNKAKSLSRRLNTWGVWKSWNSCLQQMLSMMDLHRILCTERPRTEPLFSPYASELYRILGYRSQRDHIPGALYDWSGNPMVSMYPQPPIVMSSQVQQPWASAASIPSGQLHGKPSLMIYSQNSLDCRWYAWKDTYPLSVPPVLPASVPGDTNLQLPCSTCDGSPRP
uniref:Uncharacterized protein n=1 Tax=Rattus norvegicus TaxID=10116 RepID=A0A8I6GK83_RAT